MITLLAFILTLSVLIVIHEYGHYRVAVAFNVKVLRFSVGFGRVIWRRQSTPDSTEFVLSMLPIGGYVRMLDEREGAVPTHELHRAFNRKPLLQRSAVVCAGPAANLLLAVLLYATAHWIGVDEFKPVLGLPVAGSVADSAGLRSGDWVREISNNGEDWSEVRSMTDLRWELTQAVVGGQRSYLRVTDSAGRARRQLVLETDRLDAGDIDAELVQRIGIGGPYSAPVLSSLKPDGPADKAGLRAGDQVLSVDGIDIVDGSQLRELIRASAKTQTAAAMQWRVERDTQVLDVTVQPMVVVEGSARVGRIEAYIGRTPEMVTVRYGPIEGVTRAFRRTWEMSALTLKMFSLMVIGDASLKNLSGPLTIADYAGQSVRLGLAYYLGFLAIVSVSLGVLNLLPLPMLDGGHLMYYLFEAITGRPVSGAWLEYLQRAGVAVLMMLMALALYNDVARLLSLY